MKTIFDRYKIKRDGSVWLGKYRLPQYVNSNGYLSVKIDGKFYQVHRLVAAVFVEQNGGTVVNHKDGNRHNNDADNLQWTTQKGNVLHAIMMGRHFDIARWTRENRKFV